MSAPVSKTRSRVQIALLGALFFVPFFGAYATYYLFPDWTPSNRLNYGELVSPTVVTPVLALRDDANQPLAADPLRGKWTLLQLARADCDENCRRELILSRQVRITLGAKRERVQRALIALDGVDLAAIRARLGADHPDLLWLRDAPGPGPRAAEIFARTPPNAVLVLDPKGNWMMFYPPVAADEAAIQKDFKGLQKDINKLLKLSHIG